MALLKFICMTYLIISSKGDQCNDNQHCSDCDGSTGRCLTDCDTGYFDQMCSSVCSKNCRNHSCQLSSSGSGACTEGCVSGYQGPGCNVRCGSPGGTCTTCPGGCYGGYCQLGSSCVSGCVDSYYGTGCKTCSRRCKSCNRMTGLCTECHPGYFGPNCAYSCEHCLGSCEYGCAEGCLPGFYSIFCDQKCSENCGPDPNVSTSKPLQAPHAGLRDCHRASGDCIHGCKEGWFGQRCSSPCSPNCRHNMCHSDSGKCTDGCTRGFYGGLCQHTCEVCLDGVCDQKTGTCTIGCHLTGPRCDSTCTFNCSVAECLRVEHCNQGESDSSIDHLKIGLSTSFSIFVVIILLALSPVYCKHLKTFKQHTIQGIIPHEAPSHEDQVPHDYCEIRDEDVDIMCELPGIRGDDSVAGAAPDMPVLADCFAPDCDSADSDAAPVMPVLADCFAPDCDSADSDAAPVIPVLADCFAPDCDSADSDAAPVMPVLADCFSPDCYSADSDAAPVIPVLADCFAPDCDSANSDAAPVIPVLADCFAPDCDSADNDAATSEESGVDENTYTHLVRPVVVDVPETVVNYVSPIEE